MTTFVHPYGEYSIFGTFNDWFQASVASALPSWMPSAVINFDYPSTPLTFPSFSVTHMGTDERPVAQSDYLDPGWQGVRKVHVVDISCWESRDRTPDYEMHLRQMRDMATKLIRQTHSVAIKDLYTGASAATAIGAIMRIERVDAVQSPPDENPNTERAALVAVVSWLERVPR